MDYVILDNTGNLVESFDDESEARRELDEMAQQDPEVAGEYHLVTFGEDGRVVGEPVPAGQSPEVATA